MGLRRSFAGVLPPLRLLVLPGLNTALTIASEFLTIGTKAVFTEGLTNLGHELEVVRKVMDGVQLRS
jgi:hypothetical protein